jgi:hypothetical protein
MAPPSNSQEEQQPHPRPEAASKAQGEEERVGFAPRSAQLPSLTTSQPPADTQRQDSTATATTTTQLPPLQFAQPPYPPPSYGQPQYAHNQLPPILPPTAQPNAFYPPPPHPTSFNPYAPPTAPAPASVPGPLIAPATTSGNAAKKSTYGAVPVDTTPNASFGGRKGTKRSKQHKRTRTGCAMCRSRKLKVRLDSSLLHSTNSTNCDQCDEGKPSCDRCVKRRDKCVYEDCMLCCGHVLTFDA